VEINRNQQASEEFLEKTSEVQFKDEPKSEDDAATRIVAGYLLRKAERLIKSGDKHRQAANILVEAESLIRAAKDRKALLEKKAQVARDHPSYFQRQEESLLKAAAPTKEVDLSRKANLATVPKSGWDAQKTNRNIEPAKTSLRNLMGEAAPGDKSRCAKHCVKNGKDVQGRNCPWCLGEGFIAKSTRLEQEKIAKK
jgi:hypothetical protein